MIPLFQWDWTAMEPKSSSNCLTMPGEDTGLGALASPLAGYLGKVQERAVSLEHCPWCTSKGLTHALRSYRINLQDSITLCTNPQCLFPLVSRPLEDVLASLEPTVSSKRKNDVLPEEEEEELTKPLKKRLRSSKAASHGLTCVFDSPVSPAASQLNGYQSNDQALETTGRSLPLVKDCVPEQDSNSPPCVDRPAPCVGSEDVGQSPEVVLINNEVNEEAVPSPRSCCERSISESVSKQRETPPEAVDSSSNPCPAKEIENSLDNEVEKTQKEEASLPESRSEKLSVVEAEDFVAVPEQLFWSNTANLCWLNSLLIALVTCKSLREREPQQSAVGKLLKEYDDICSVIRTHQHTDTDGVIRVPNHMLQKANEDLESLRKHIFQLLKPKLKCRMGQKGSPVFAMPALLSMDSWAECHFQSAFTWEFKCSKCDYVKNERVTKTLPSVTNLVPDWRPLNAVHAAPCNKCRSRKQQRAMKLERLPSVFALHFVKGLPDDDVGVYTFDFNKQSYSVTTVIQYKQQLRHFVTWTRNVDGSWLEYDDLKHPVCKAHQKLAVPPCEMHIVFWEAGQINEPRVCSPSSTFTESLSKSQTLPSLTKTPAEELLTCSPDQSLLLAPHDSDIIHAFSEAGDVTDTTLTADASIGTTTLLDTFEGLTHSDIITLTLVECKPDKETQMLNHNDEQSAPSRNDAADSTPDSSSAAVESKNPPSHDVELSTVSISSDSESPDNSFSDSTFVPSAKRGTAARRKRAKSKALSEAAVMAAIVESPAVKEDDTHREPTLVSTTGSSPLPDLNCRWSYLLSKHQPPKPAPIQTPSVIQVKSSTPPLFSTPKPVKNPYTPAVSYTKKLKTEDSGILPLKAAETYEAFRARNSSTPKHVQPIVASEPTNVTVTSLKGVSEMSSTRKAALQSAEPPLALTSTDALRYKLLKKLKAKKKKLAKLQMLLGDEGGVSLHPDSTDLCSPSTVSSSTYDGSACDDFLSDLLSPATTASHLSPDSTEYMEMIANTQGGANHLSSTQTLTHVNVGANEPSGENFLEEFLSQAAAQRPTDMETEALNALELFI
ncbi:SUMO-specific isopeptidase USPL1 [Gouania willdenowi]|uniref:USP domain-containing protein n=1 Tax=Gouania willdenowi TaxID=441366 RepID=A0A8C5DS40_GOUWI|nr:SUMO-specific isopeptidase USPL1 [Gouania willdenowi]XP_028323029.1 SUMO-specific isopeptidase USPL1 [Gouania willdenowi]